MPPFVNKILDLSAAFGLYDWWAARNLEGVHDTLIGLANIQGHEEILDVGCGTGIIGYRLVKAFDGIMFRGVDVGKQMIAIAERRLGEHYPSVEYTVGTAVRLPYANGQFDVTTSCLVFHLLRDSDKELALWEIFRILKPGGRYVCAEFAKYPAGLSCRALLTYPSYLIDRVGFHVHAQHEGPSITKCRSIVYRVLTKPAGAMLPAS